MPKPNPKDKNQKQNIVGKALKDIIPSSYPHVQDPKEVEYPSQGEKIYSPENIPAPLYPEWPKDETDLENLLKPLTPETEEENNEVEKYIDPNNSKVLLPLSLFTDYLNMNIKWSSPEKYIQEINLDKLIQKQMPKKNSYKFRMKVHEFYEKELLIRKQKAEEANEENEINENKNEESEDNIDNKDEFLIYRDFFKILDNPLNIQIVNFIKRLETEEEMLERIKKLEEELQHQQHDKNKKAKARTSKNFQGEILQEKVEITIPSPNNINLKEGLPPYFRWLGSIFQIIKDRNLLDVKTGENIWAKIYPQKNGVPYYNKNGHYIVKLHHMGKLRAIDIDDRMPLSDRDEYFFPKCESLEELWPALLTKALLKLYSYKIISNKFKEIGDPEPFYALTGYIPTLLKEISIGKNIKKKFKIGSNLQQSKIEEIDSKRDESSNNKENKEIPKENNNIEINNNNEDNININNNKSPEEQNNDSLEKNENKEVENNEQHNEENKNIQNENKPQDKLDFFEKASNDEN